MSGWLASKPPGVSCSIVVISGFAVTATVIVVVFELPDDADPFELEQAASPPTARTAVATASSLVPRCRLMFGAVTDLLLTVNGPSDLNAADRVQLLPDVARLRPQLLILTY